MPINPANTSCAPSSPPLMDARSRPMRDLRISVTDRCNLRCTYCMPREIFDKNHVFLPRSDLLSFEEIVSIARIFVSLGIKKIRLTGGEPLLRRGVENLVRELAKLTDDNGMPVEVTLTTNGVLLAQKAKALKDAGLARLTVSLDGLSDAVFKRMSDVEVPVSTILYGISSAEQAGFTSIKVNMVVKRHVNDHELLPMARHFRNSGIALRFIEYMDVGNTNGWRMEEVVTASEILEAIGSQFPLQRIGAKDEVAQRWRYLDGGGEIGIIASVTQAFCGGCTRMRLSTNGKLYTCLFAEDAKADLKTMLRNGKTEQDLMQAISACWMNRDDRYSQIRNQLTESQLKKIEMSYIGG